MEKTVTLETLVQQQPKLADKKLIVATAWLMDASDGGNDLEYLCARLNSLSAGIEVAIRALSERTITRQHQQKLRKLLAV